MLYNVFHPLVRRPGSKISAALFHVAVCLEFSKLVQSLSSKLRDMHRNYENEIKMLENKSDELNEKKMLLWKK
ncbi:hypothetical protein DICVIV_12267 [Dictyocaulus viviparus]|uniref:Uncharacterized protein n=1 Tax=Dictyocaulus viviparus TaxID=29172 RepID=A0A0D8XAX9_DICVI|nr:hypothetical protein DICVIV_12267 [Dictyocaulus viviparus]